MTCIFDSYFYCPWNREINTHMHTAHLHTHTHTHPHTHIKHTFSCLFCERTCKCSIFLLISLPRRRRYFTYNNNDFVIFLSIHLLYCYLFIPISQIGTHNQPLRTKFHISLSFSHSCTSFLHTHKNTRRNILPLPLFFTHARTHAYLSLSARSKVLSLSLSLSLSL